MFGKNQVVLNIVRCCMDGSSPSDLNFRMVSDRLLRVEGEGSSMLSINSWKTVCGITSFVSMWIVNIGSMADAEMLLVVALVRDSSSNF